MTKIYEQHEAAFKYTAAYVVLNTDFQRVATIAFKFPKDGAGRLYAYVHWLGCEMVRGFAGGYGYDKTSAAVESAIEKLVNHGVSFLSVKQAGEKAEDWENYPVEKASADD